MRIFKDINLVESLGSGMGKIMEAYDQSIFTFLDTFLIVTFPFAEGYDTIKDTLNINDTINDTLNRNDTINDIINDTINDTINLCESKNQILKVIKKNPKITIDKIAETTTLSRISVIRHLKTLQEMGVVARVGSRKTGYWEIERKKD